MYQVFRVDTTSFLDSLYLVHMACSASSNVECCTKVYSILALIILEMNSIKWFYVDNYLQS